MTRTSLLKLLTLVLLGTTFAYSQATRTWVSGVGDDANPCSRTAPCKTFAGAISKTAPGGEIDALDPGGFGAGRPGYYFGLWHFWRFAPQGSHFADSQNRQSDPRRGEARPPFRSGS